MFASPDKGDSKLSPFLMCLYYSFLQSKFSPQDGDSDHIRESHHCALSTQSALKVGGLEQEGRTKSFLFRLKDLLQVAGCPGMTG